MSAILSLNYSVLSAALAKQFLGTSFASNSSNWYSAYNTMQTLSGGWQSSLTTVSGVSSSWVSTYNTVNALSTNWNLSFNSMSALSGNWQSTTSTVANTSAKWMTKEMWGYIPASFVAGTTYQINEGAIWGGTIYYLNVRLSAGYGTMLLNLNNASTSAFPLSTSRYVYTPMVNYNAGDSLSLTLCSVSAASNLSYTLGILYNAALTAIN